MKNHDVAAQAMLAQIKAGQPNKTLQAQSTSYYGFQAQHGKFIPFLTPAQVASALGVSIKTLERWRTAGGGPPFIKTAGKRIRYPVVELDRWVAALLNSQDSPGASPTGGDD